MRNITDVSTFTDPVTVLEDGDPVDQAHSQPTGQALANRTRFFMDLLGAFLKTPVQSAAGYLYAVLRGSSKAGILELSTAESDVDARIVGIVQFADQNNTNADKSVARIYGKLSGATATKRGGRLVFECKTNNSDSEVDVLELDDQGATMSGGLTVHTITLVGTGTLDATGVISTDSNLVADGDVSGATSTFADDIWINCSGNGASAATKNAGVGMTPATPGNSAQLKFTFAARPSGANYLFDVNCEIHADLEVNTFKVITKTSTVLELKYCDNGSFAGIDTSGHIFQLRLKG